MRIIHLGIEDLCKKDLAKFSSTSIVRLIKQSSYMPTFRCRFSLIENSKFSSSQIMDAIKRADAALAIA